MGGETEARKSQGIAQGHSAGMTHPLMRKARTQDLRVGSAGGVRFSVSSIWGPAVNLESRGESGVQLGSPSHGMSVGAGQGLEQRGGAAFGVGSPPCDELSKCLSLLLPAYFPTTV